MTKEELEELLRDCPVLYHMAELGSWPSIQRHGLLSTSALLDLFAVSGSRRTAVEARRRPENVAIEHPKLGRAVIRDQKPMDDAGLMRCLQDGLTPEDWYKLLNDRVFMWLTRDRLHRLLTARPYRTLEHDVLELDAAPLVVAHRTRVTLSPINSGATKPFPRDRGKDTFLSVEDYPYAQWRGKRKAGERAVELAVIGGIPDVGPFVRRVLRMRGEEIVTVLYSR
ncbi:DUF7002 family protein [Muricoccus vinaceus]|uniref:DUF7002 family protein n=1 Tax=Muricoccus vinaceus TaxID=424704 RepID=A0ABV6J0X5_9PROT